jgi:hypothetical protein
MRRRNTGSARGRQATSRESSSAPQHGSDKSLAGIVFAVAGFLFIVIIAVMTSKFSRSYDKVQSVSTLQTTAARSSNDISLEWLVNKLDAVLLLCDDCGEDHVSQVVRKRHEMLALTARKRKKERAKNLPILTLPHSGLPLTVLKYAIEDQVVKAMSTTDLLIGTAFYARTSMTDIMGWRHLLIVMSEVSARVAAANSCSLCESDHLCV